MAGSCRGRRTGCRSLEPTSLPYIAIRSSKVKLMKCVGHPSRQTDFTFINDFGAINPSLRRPSGLSCHCKRSPYPRQCLSVRMQLLQAGSPRSQPTFRAEYTCQYTLVMVSWRGRVCHSAPLHVQQPCGALVVPLVARVGFMIGDIHGLMTYVGQ